MTSQQSVALIRKQGFVIGVLGLLFDMLYMGVCTARHWQMSGRLVQEINVCTIGWIVSQSYSNLREVCMFRDSCPTDHTNKGARCIPYLELSSGLVPSIFFPIRVKNFLSPLLTKL